MIPYVTWSKLGTLSINVEEGPNRNYTVNLSYLSYFMFIKFTNGYYTFVN